MDSSHATFPGGGFDTEAGYTEVGQRLANGTLRVPAHEAGWFEEYRNLHRKDNLIVKEDDDLLSATRTLCMAIRRAKIMDRAELGQPNYYARPYARAQRPQQQIAKNADFDLFSGQPFD
jgi:hypothetical protein